MEAKVDLLVPMLGVDSEPWLDCVTAALLNNRVPVNFYAYCDGGRSEAHDTVREAIENLRSKFVNARVLTSPGRLYFSKVVNRLLRKAADSSARFAAVIHPCVVIETKDWLDRLLLPFSKDKNAAYVAATGKGQAAGRPFKLRTSNTEPHLLRLGVFNKVALKKVGLLFDTCPDDLHGEMLVWQTKALGAYWNCWRDTSVGYLERDAPNPVLSDVAYSEVVKRSGSEPLVLVDM